MSEEDQQEKQASSTPIRHRRCPSCQGPVTRFILSAISLPIEQFAIPWLREVNAAIHWSVRPFGSSDMNELQFLAFTNICSSCGNISWWDLDVEELEYILNHPSAEASIHWNYEPRRLTEVESRLPDDKKWIVSKLLDNMKIERNGNEPAK